MAPVIFVGWYENIKLMDVHSFYNVRRVYKKRRAVDFHFTTRDVGFAFMPGLTAAATKKKLLMKMISKKYSARHYRRSMHYPIIFCLNSISIWINTNIWT